MRQICHRAIKYVPVGDHELIFCTLKSSKQSEHGARMFFLVDGSLTYEHWGSDRTLLDKDFQGWLCEGCLWTSEWIHCGTCIAASEGRLAAICMQKFQAIV